MMLALYCLSAAAFPAHAQESAQTKTNESQSSPTAIQTVPEKPQQSTKTQSGGSGPAQFGSLHKFWDRENGLLFAAVGAGRGLDYASTLNLRRRGIDEAFLTNSIVDNHAAFVGIEVAATAASIGVSYIFHRTGHHRLERWTSVVHAGVAVGGAIRNYALPTPH
jgi:hypothetical protein